MSAIAIIMFMITICEKHLLHGSRTCRGAWKTHKYSQMSMHQSDLIPSTQNDIHQHRFSVAPMMDYTDRHQRYFQRLLSKEAVLYTEMVTSYAIVHRYLKNELQRDLESNDPIEDPVILQLGGSDPQIMKQAAAIATKLYP